MKYTIETKFEKIEIEILDYKNTIEEIIEHYRSTARNVSHNNWFWDSGAYSTELVSLHCITISDGYYIHDAMYISSPGIVHHDDDRDESCFNVLIPTRGFDKYTMKYISLEDDERMKVIRRGEAVAFQQRKIHSLAPVRPTTVPFESILLCVKRGKT